MYVPQTASYDHAFADNELQLWLESSPASEVLAAELLLSVDPPDAQGTTENTELDSDSNATEHEGDQERGELDPTLESGLRHWLSSGDGKLA